MKLNRLFLIGALSTAVIFSACDKDDDDNNETTNAQDQTFVMQAAMSNRAEVEMGNLATTRASHPSVKAFAQMMVMEHTTAQTELADVADDVDLGLADSLDADAKSMQQMLTGLSGTAFDQAYMSGQVAAHQKTLTNFDAELSAGSNQKVKGYASKYRPHIQMHLDSATAIYNRIK